MKLKEKLNQAAGFTLVELIVVIAILAILAGIAVPVYSGYIEKANLAADQQLLAAVNRAFAAACAEKGINTATLTAGTAVISIDATTGKINTNSVAPEAVRDAFKTYYAGNEDAAFKVYKSLMFQDGAFVEGSAAYSNLTFDSNLLSQLAGSTFITADGLGVDGLLGKVNDVTGYAALIANGALAEVYRDPAFQLYMAEAFNISYEEGNMEDLAEKMQEQLPIMCQKLIDQAAAEGKTLTTEQALSQLKANAAVLYAAENSSNMDASDITSLLSTDGAADTIKGHLNSDAGTALSEASVAYGMFTAYVYSLSDDYVRESDGATKQDLIAATSNPLEILDNLNDDGFQAYISSSQGQTDLNGYLAAMEIITSSSTDQTAVESLIFNGFDDPALAALLASALNSQSNP